MDTSRLVDSSRIRAELLDLMGRRRIRQADIIRASKLNKSTVQRVLAGKMCTPLTIRQLRDGIIAINTGTYEVTSYRVGHRMRMPHPINRTHCVWGHPFTPNNTRVSNEGKRICRICDAARRRKWRALKKMRQG